MNINDASEDCLTGNHYYYCAACKNLQGHFQAHGLIFRISRNLNQKLRYEFYLTSVKCVLLTAS
jgi:hypothetical protein